MIRARHIILLLIVFSFFLATQIVQAQDINEEAYQNRFSLKAGTILNNEQQGEWRGIGDCLIFPYYDARQIDGKQQKTVITIKNTAAYGIVAKLRFREWFRGREVFSKDIWIPSSSLSDNVVWQGTIESNGTGTNAVITSLNDVVYRNDASNFYLSDSFSSGLPFSTRILRRGSADSTLYGFIEVIGEEKTSPENTNGIVPRLAQSERDCPNTLLGKGFIQRPDEGISMGYDAMAIGNFSRGQGSLFISTRSPYPRLDTCEDTLDQLEFQLSKSEIYAPYAVNPSNAEKTSVIVTYPTKFFHYLNGTRISLVNNPFEAFTENAGERIDIAFSEQGQNFVDSWFTVPYSVNVIGLYRDYTATPSGIDNIPMQTYSSELGEAALASNNLSERVLIPDYEYYSEGRFIMYRGLPAVGLVLQESLNSGQLNASLTPVKYSTQWIASGAETISTPATPSGPNSGEVGTSYTYTTSGSSSNLGHFLEYQFDWMGDGSTDLSAWGADTQSKTWTVVGMFAVRVRARCMVDTSIVSNWSNGINVSIGQETVSVPTAPTGPSFGVVNKDENYPFDKSYSFTTGGSSSSFGHPVQYQFDWKGDGSDLSAWGPFIQSQTWTQGGVYTVRAIASCTTHPSIVSSWSNGFVVTIEEVSSPSRLEGPTAGLPDPQYTFSTGGALSNLAHSVQYLFDWGDGTDSGWLPVGTTSAKKIWSTGKKEGYLVRTRARCATDTLAVSDWTGSLIVNIEYISAPKAPAGPDKGISGQSYTYITGDAFSNIGHVVEYQFDWNGDGTTDLSSWGSATRSKSWTTGATYSVRARARCATHKEIVSDWSSAFTVDIETISTPTTPSQQPSGDGLPNTIYTYSTGGATSSIGDPVQYYFNFGDGTNSGWLPVGVTSFSKIWTGGGTFTVQAKARCSIHTSTESAWSTALTVNIETVTAPNIPTVTGAPPWVLGTTYTFSAGGATSSLAHPLQYMFDWGDGTSSTWIDAGTGGTATATKAWNAAGTYSVTATARCKTHPNAVSVPSVDLVVTIIP